MAAYDSIYLSPHLDDAVFSCGGQIHRLVRAGQRILVVTFTTAVPGEVSSSAAEGLHRLWGLSAGEVLARRCREDEEACAVLGVDHRHVAELDALYRCHPESGEPFYRHVEDLFRVPAAADEAHVAVLAERLRELPDASRICAPLGVGRHVDHVFLRRAAEEVYGGRVELYEDYPYVHNSFLALWKVLGLRRGWTPRLWRLDEDDVEAKCAAARCYDTQVPALFGSEEGMEDRMWAYVDRLGGERLWWRG